MLCKGSPYPPCPSFLPSDLLSQSTVRCPFVFSCLEIIVLKVSLGVMSTFSEIIIETIPFLIPRILITRLDKLRRVWDLDNINDK